MPRCNVYKLSDCQFMCQTNPFCKAFQYAPPPGLTGECTTGECYLAREYATENNAETYAGPKFCGKHVSKFIIFMNAINYKRIVLIAQQNLF